MGRRIEDRMEELLPVAAELAGKYTGGMSTSVTYEKAQELMEAVLYCIREYEQEQEFLHALMPAGEIPAEEMYQKGCELVIRKVKKMRVFYNRVMKSFCSYGCKSCADVMEKGLPEFFRRYDPGFSPQKTLLMLDYPTLLPMNGLTGIDAVEQYLSYISLEQRFLGAFEEAYVRRTFRAYAPDYEEQFFNMCGVFLEHVLVCVLMEKPLQEPAGLEHLNRLDRWLGKRSVKEIEAELGRLLRKLTEERFHGNELLYEYLCGALPDLAVRIREGCFFTDSVL